MSPCSPLYFLSRNAKNHWPLFLGCRNESVICLLPYNADRYIHFGRMWQCCSLIAECIRMKIIDNQLTLTLITLKQPLWSQQFMKQIIYTLLTSDIVFVCIIVCIQEFCCLSFSDQLLSTLCEWEMTWPYHIPAHSASNSWYIHHFTGFW